MGATVLVRHLRSHANCGYLFVLLSTLILLYFAVSLVCDRFVVSNPHDVLASTGTSQSEVAKTKPPSFKKISQQKTADDLLVLFWTPLFGSSQLWFTYFSDAFQQPCAKSCSLTTDKSRIEEADAIIFSSYPEDQIAPPSYRHPGQLWVFFSQESPSVYPRTHQSYSRWDGLFNWTLTYRMDSDIRLLYGRTIKKKNAEVSSFNSSLAVLANKKKLVAAVISHCKTPFDRLAYIEKLRKAGIEVDLYGKCGSFKCPTDERDPTRCFEDISKTYKFVLAFENSICKDYVTEKLFEALLHPWVPVVIGGADYSAVAPPKSVIDATSMSPEDLAALLKKLDDDEEEYKKFFAWRSSFEVRRHTLWGCWFCDKLQKWVTLYPNLTQTYPDVHDWWVIQAQCQNDLIMPRF